MSDEGEVVMVSTEYTEPIVHAHERSTYLFDTWGDRKRNIGGVKRGIYTNERESKAQSKNCKQVWTATEKP